MAIQFSLKTMPFTANINTSEEWTQVGYEELAATAEITAGDYSEIFYAILAILCGANNSKYSMDELFTEIFSVQSSATDTDRRLVEGIYGGRIKKKDDQLLLIFGNRQFPVTQDGETLICGNVSGRVVSTPKQDAAGGQFFVLEWTPKATYEDKSFRYTIPVAIAKVDDKFPSMDLDRLEDIADKNNLIDWVEVVGANGSFFKAYQLFAGIGIQSFKVVDVSVTPSNKEGYKDNVLFTLEDGRKVNANSNAQAYFIKLSEADRKAAIPCLWTISKYEEKKCFSSIESLGKKIGSTKIPSFANLIGGSTADFKRLSGAQTRVAVAPVAVIEPSKSANAPNDDDDDDHIPF
jgi:hypothetical protein